MLDWILAALSTLPAQDAKPPAPAAAPQRPAATADKLESELLALTREYETARKAYDKHLDELRRQGEKRPETAVEHPSVAFWPRVVDLADRGSSGARLWLGLQYANAHPGPETPEREKAWREHLLAAVEAGAN